MKTNLMEKESLLIYASQQALSSVLGFDEAQIYYCLLIKNNSKIDQEYSYSKKYRAMKNLFDAGAVGKFKPKEKDLFNYFILPPSFLSFTDVEAEIVNYLELIYLENHADMIKRGLSQILLKDERSILVFLLKYFMKDSAKVVAKDLNIKKIFGNISGKIDLTNNDASIKSGIIDKKLSYEFVKIPALNEIEYIGYISNSLEIVTINH